ncbi:MAG: hypothetical protein EKK53_21530 [Burkholderiales bacterium]|nr:MAG: hypothetical protein EKK53_21530 [Burkholderiales bacterium]
MRQPTNVVNNAPDFMMGWDNGQPVLVRPSEVLKEGLGSDTAAIKALSAGSWIRGAKAPQPSFGGDAISLSQISIVAGAPTVTVTTGPNGMPALKIVTGVGAPCDIAIPGMVDSYFHGDAFICAHGDRSTGLDYFTFYVSQNDATYTNGASGFVQYGLTNPTSNSFEQQGANTYHFRRAALTPIGAPTYPMQIGQCKFRVQPLAGQTCTVFIYAVGIAPVARKSRICVVWDDGYDSAFRLGVDSFGSRGIKQTMAVIGSVQGAGNGYSTLAQLRAFVDSGNALVAHGPWPSDATSQGSNIVDLYAATGDPVSNAVADARAARQWINDQGLSVPGFEKCYVWPQGKFQAFSGDLRYLNAMRDAGFTTCRNVGNVVGSAQPASYNFDATSKYGHMALPIIGHTWAGTTANEATNITNITNAIAAMATNRTDAFLMLHRVVRTGTSDGAMGAAGGISIRQGDLETIAAAIKTQIDNGTMDAVTMPELALSNGWWQQF